MDIYAARLDRAYEKHKEEYDAKALEVLRSGSYICGRELAGFEEAFASYLGVSHCVGVNSGLDALRITFRVLGLGPGDEVLVQGNTFIAGFMGISDCGATPVAVEPDAYYGIDPADLEKKITSRTRAVLATHLFGMMTPMEPIVSLCEKHGLLLVEDCAQAHGASERGKKAGSFGYASCFSFYPTKNLGGFGDGGAIVTNDASFAEKCRIFRNNGSEKKYCNAVVGVNSRLDELQAGLLRIRLKYLDEMNAERSALAARYTNEIRNPLLRLPGIRPDVYNVWHQYVVRCRERDALQRYLHENGVHTLIHYPIPAHLSEAYAYLGLQPGSLPVTEALSDTVLSLPIYNEMSFEEQSYVIGLLNAFAPDGRGGEAGNRR